MTSKTGTTLAKEIWTRDDGLKFTIIAKQRTEDRGTVWVLTNEADFVTGYHKQIVQIIPSIGGLEGLRWNFKTARAIAKRQGLSKAA